MACSSYTLNTTPSSFVNPSSSIQSRSLFTNPIAKNFSPFTPSNSKGLKLNTTFSNTYLSSVPKRSFSCRSQAEPIDSEKVQQIHVYEINEGDRGSPTYLRYSHKPVNSLGDLIPFSNKVYTGDLKKRIGISAGMYFMIQHKTEKKGDRYEAVYSIYFGNYGSISLQGPFLSYEDSYVAITGGSGIFEGVSGQVEVHQIVNQNKIFYTFYLKGIKDLPNEFFVKPVKPNPSVEPSPDAKALKPHATIITGYVD